MALILSVAVFFACKAIQYPIMVACDCLCAKSIVSKNTALKSHKITDAIKLILWRGMELPARAFGKHFCQRYIIIKKRENQADNPLLQIRADFSAFSLYAGEGEKVLLGGMCR